MSRAGVEFCIRREQGRVVGRACENKKGEFGNSILLSDIATAKKLAAEKLAAEKLAAEKLAAEKLAAEKLAAEKLTAERLTLTEKSKAIIAQLNEAHAKSSYPSYVRLFSPY